MQQSRFSADGWVENELQAEGSNLMRVAVFVHYSKSGRSTSALGQKRTSRHVRSMSALPPKVLKFLRWPGGTLWALFTGQTQRA
jgi:hypothetical protein